MVTLHEDKFTFMIIFHRMRNVWGKTCRQNQNTFILNSVFTEIVPFMR